MTRPPGGGEGAKACRALLASRQACWSWTRAAAAAPDEVWAMLAAVSGSRTPRRTSRWTSWSPMLSALQSCLPDVRC